MIIVNFEKAREITKERLRRDRKPLLEEQDTLFMKALEDDDSSAQSTIKATKKKLRDAPAASAISSADTITKLKAAWHTSTLGKSPYV